MNEGLRDPFRHNAWATRQLIAFCRDLPHEQLRASATGAYGSVLDTLGHLVGAEGWYRFLLVGERPPWSPLPEETPGLDALGEYAVDMEAFWEGFLEAPLDSERTIAFDDDGNPYQVRAGVLLAQILNHGNEHRDQVCTILTSLGVKPPELDGWAWGEAVGQAGPDRA